MLSSGKLLFYLDSLPYGDGGFGAPTFPSGVNRISQVLRSARKIQRLMKSRCENFVLVVTDNRAVALWGKRARDAFDNKMHPSLGVVMVNWQVSWGGSEYALLIIMDK